MMVSDTLVYLPQDILLKVDRASMSHSLEVRAPFLDSSVVELAFSFPRKWHRRGFSGKKMMNNSFADYIPLSIWKRRKQGFSVPVGQWFKGKLAFELLGLLESSDNVFNHAEVKRMLSTHKKGKNDYGLHLWQIYIYLLWHESFVVTV
jgi:asparagine synthase (glutamine-hydrolysing)